MLAVTFLTAWFRMEGWGGGSRIWDFNGVTSPGLSFHLRNRKASRQTGLLLVLWDQALYLIFQMHTLANDLLRTYCVPRC